MPRLYLNQAPADEAAFAVKNIKAANERFNLDRQIIDLTLAHMPKDKVEVATTALRTSSAGPSSRNSGLT
ncbi:hypothetical protein [Kaistia defluvii]|uniref:Uncharacterized protein n=1 Tax=Kaistia defluvii TaxID=410841 RepID=A0ABV2R0Y7_9HYPH